MWLGDRNENDRLVVNWKPVKFFNKQGVEVPEGNPEIFSSIYEPDNEQKDIFIELDKNPNKAYDYNVDIDSKKLVPKE
jgi:hypothetical protein